MNNNWLKETGVGVTVCNSEGIMIYLNDLAEKIFSISGGRELIGKNLLDCHPEDAKPKIIELFENKLPHCYTVTLKGKQYILFQYPWYEEGSFMGFVEFIHALPQQMPNLDKIRWVENKDMKSNL